MFSARQANVACRRIGANMAPTISKHSAKIWNARKTDRNRLTLYFKNNSNPENDL